MGRSGNQNVLQNDFTAHNYLYSVRGCTSVDETGVEHKVMAAAKTSNTVRNWVTPLPLLLSPNTGQLGLDWVLHHPWGVKRANKFPWPWMREGGQLAMDLYLRNDNTADLVRHPLGLVMASVDIWWLRYPLTIRSMCRALPLFYAIPNPLLKSPDRLVAVPVSHEALWKAAAGSSCDKSNLGRGNSK